MKQDTRTKTERVAACLKMARERGRKVTRQAARIAIDDRIMRAPIKLICWQFGTLAECRCPSQCTRIECGR